MTRHTLQPDGLFSSKPWGFSQVCVSPPGHIVHIAGQVPWDSSGNVSADGFRQQLAASVNNVLVALAAAGGRPEHLQMLRIYVVNMQSGRDAEVIRDVLTDIFGTGDPPASSWIGVHSLAQPEYLVEVEGVAVIH